MPGMMEEPGFPVAKGQQHYSTIIADVQNCFWNAVLFIGSKSCFLSIKFAKIKRKVLKQKGSITFQVMSLIVFHWPTGWGERRMKETLLLPPFLSPLLPPTVPLARLPAHSDLAVEGDGLTLFDPLNARPGHGKTHSDIMRLGVYFTQAAGGPPLCLAGKAADRHQIPALRLSINSAFSDVPRKIC